MCETTKNTLRYRGWLCRDRETLLKADKNYLVDLIERLENNWADECTAADKLQDLLKRLYESIG